MNLYIKGEHKFCHYVNFYIFNQLLMQISFHKLEEFLIIPPIYFYEEEYGIKFQISLYSELFVLAK